MNLPLTDAERAILQARLDKAEIAYDAIMTGKGVRKFVDQNGESVEYSATNLELLRAYIAELKALLNPCYARFQRPRPIGFLF